MLLDLGKSKYIPGSHVKQAHVAAIRNGNILDEEFIPVGCDIVVNKNIKKSKGVYHTNKNILEILYLDNLPLGLKLYNSKGEVSARSIDLHLNTLMHHISGLGDISVDSANEKTRKMMSIYGDKPPGGLINAVTTPSHGVRIPEYYLFHNLRNDDTLDKYEFPCDYIKRSERLDPIMTNILTEKSIIHSNNLWLKEYMANIFEIEIPQDDVRIDTLKSINKWDDMFRVLILKLYESEYTDIFFRVVPNSKTNIDQMHKSNPITKRISCEDDCGVGVYSWSILKKLFDNTDLVQVEVTKTIREEGMIRLMFENKVLCYYFDIGIHLMCRCSIENV